MNSFIIGAGFTKSIFPCAPLNNDLLTDLAAGKSSCASQALMDKYKTKDVEIALTKLDVDIAASFADNKKSYKKLREIRRKIEIDLANHFMSYKATYELMEQSPWLKNFMQSVIADGDVAISLNYDCVFEGALCSIGKWSPKDGYGLDNPLVDDKGSEISPIIVLKIHGSITFKIAAYRNKPDCSAVGFIINECFFPGLNMNLDYGLGRGETYLIAPSFVKVPTVEIAYLMLDALKAVSKSQNLIIVGCSLRPEDDFLTLLLTHFLRQPDWRSRKIIILDFNANDIASRVEKYWGVNIEKCVVPINGYIENSIEKVMEVIKK